MDMEEAKAKLLAALSNPVEDDGLPSLDLREMRTKLESARFANPKDELARQSFLRKLEGLLAKESASSASNICGRDAGESSDGSSSANAGVSGVAASNLSTNQPSDAASSSPIGDSHLATSESTARFPLVGTNPLSSGVLVVATPDMGGSLVLTKRSSKLSKHAGEVSFPGGRMEKDDADLGFTALREAREEIGLDPSLVELLGELPPLDTLTGFRMHPFIGVLVKSVDFTLEPAEVESIVHLPFEVAFDPSSYQLESFNVAGIEFPTWSLMAGSPKHRIWGATARVLYRFALSISGKA